MTTRDMRCEDLVGELRVSLERAKEAERANPSKENCDEVAMVDALLLMSRNGVCKKTFDEMDEIAKKRAGD